MELNPKIKEALIKTDFIKRYRNLSDSYSAQRTSYEKRLAYPEKDKVMEIIQELGYSCTFEQKEKFYKITEQKIGDFTYCVHIILRDGMAELVWVVKENGELLLGAPLGVCSKRLTDGERIKKPVFSSYEDLGEILKALFVMFEDFKAALSE